MDKLLSKLKNNKLKVITASMVGIIVILIAFLYFLLSPYFSNKVTLVDKTLETKQNIDNTIDIELPDEEVNDTDNEADDKQADQINIYKEEKKEDEIINILLCGMDARRYDSKSRSDTIILASYNKTQHTVKLVSFMRDSWVYLPEKGWQRINTATVYGGVGLLVNTLNYNFGLDIQDYIQIKFDDFKTIIDILGGIEVELTSSEIRYINNKLHVEDGDYKNDIKAEPGLITLNGAQALWHCRNRTIGNSDFERTDRQREVLGIIINKALTLNPGQATRMIFEMREHVNTNLDMETILSLASDALIHKRLSVDSSRIPFDDSFRFANKNGASVLELDFDKNIELLYDFLGYELEEPSSDDSSSEDTLEGKSESSKGGDTTGKVSNGGDTSESKDNDKDTTSNGGDTGASSDTETVSSNTGTGENNQEPNSTTAEPENDIEPEPKDTINESATNTEELDGTAENDITSTPEEPNINTEDETLNEQAEDTPINTNEDENSNTETNILESLTENSDSISA